jgi:hypothetical protein
VADSALWVLVQSHPVAALVVIFVLDGLGVALLPELAVLGAFFLHPTAGWAVGLVALAAGVEVLVAAFLHALTGVVRLPRWLRRLMDGYSGALLLHDERLVLLNRVVPVLPVVGAFIRVRQWRPGRALAYVGLGSMAKYGLLLAVAHVSYEYFASAWAFGVSLGLAASFLLASWSYTGWRWVAARRARLDVEAA